jgi:hypothetical protein
MNNRCYKYTLFFALPVCFLLLSAVTGCAGKQVPAASPQQGSSSGPAQILYLTLEALKDTLTNSIQISIIQQKLVNGTIKKGAAQNAASDSSNWLITLQNSNNKTVSELILANPMRRELESVNEKGVFVRKTVQLARAEVPLRFAYDSSIKKLTIAEIKTNRTPKIIFRSDLVF